MAEISPHQAETLQAISRGLDPNSGLPTSVFDFAYAIVPMINVDLLALAEGRFLLTWRQDQFATGWHIPGGIFRRCEAIVHRIEATARDELGAYVEASKAPAAIVEIFSERGHNISFLYPCRLTSSPMKRVLSDKEGAQPGDLFWFDTIPQDLYPTHQVYADLILELASGRPIAWPRMLRSGDAQSR